MVPKNTTQRFAVMRSGRMGVGSRDRCYRGAGPHNSQEAGLSMGRGAEPTGGARWRALRLLLLVILICGSLAPSALAARCGRNPVCPYGRMQVLGGSDADSLSGQLAVALTPAGNVVLSDSGRQSVREFTRSGQLIMQIGAADDFGVLRGVAVDPVSGEIYVEDAGCVWWVAPDGTVGGADGSAPARRRRRRSPRHAAPA